MTAPENIREARWENGNMVYFNDEEWGRAFSYSFGSDGRLEAANDGSYFYEFKYAE